MSPEEEREELARFLESCRAIMLELGPREARKAIQRVMIDHLLREASEQSERERGEGDRHA